ncbi:MAG: extracellular solute-binding protein, partial [Aestuariivirgaceae bacterium]|nr:extracellular solute-binding protein [Aestuariivirgaceae bacterium]
MIANRGEAATKEWLTGLKANLAIKPSGNDRSQAKSVFAGECDVAIANTYYMGKMMTNTQEPEQQKWAEAVRIVFPSSSEMPTNVNISGMMLTKASPNKAEALKLMAFLASPQAQKIYAEGNFEYPVNPAVEPSEIVQAWGTLTPDPMPVADLAKHMKRASELVDEVRFDD